MERGIDLEKYRGQNTRHRCPSCGKPKEFTRYIYVDTGEYLADHVGLCNRVDKCGYHYPPKQFFQDNPITRQNENRSPTTPKIKKPEAPISFIDYKYLEKSCSVPYRRNHLFQFFEAMFSYGAARELFLNYLVGTSTIEWPGATAFWQIDVKERVRQCKMMQYDPRTGKRNKELRARFMGKKLLGNLEARFEQCFFGEHLLNEHPQKTVAIVESEKTAMYCSLCFPDMVWLATGGKYGCKWQSNTAEVCKPLAHRKVILFPDLSATQDWREMGEQVARVIPCKIMVSSELERAATPDDKAEGLDIMDFLLREKTDI